jgi:hypothetical protein
MRLSSIHRIGLAAILFENLKDDFGFVIGRADKRYTLWKYRKENNAFTLAFVQVLSPNRFVVAQRFPEVYICEELRGENRMVINRTGSVNNKHANAPKTIFDFLNLPFGEFSGMLISEVNEYQWCRLANIGNFKWTDAYGEEFDFEELVLNKLNEFSCKCVNNEWYTPKQLENPKLWLYLANTQPEVVEYQNMCENLGMQKLMGRWFSPIALDGEKPWMVTAREILPNIEKGEAFSFVAHFNGNSFFFGLPVEFRAEDKEDVYTYYGSAHYLKATNKKGVKVNKRVKGKTINVTDYEIAGDENNPYVLVNKFNII